MAKFQPCEGATSDHAWRSISVEFVDQSNNKTPAIQGTTWNMQMRCVSKETARRRLADPKKAHTNNPLNIDETPEEFFIRKNEQLRELEAFILNKQDFIFLQEPDWIYDAQLRKMYQTMLHKHGWAMISTTDLKRIEPDLNAQYQPLVTLYNTKRLTPDPKHPSAGRFESEAVHGKFRALQTNFIDQKTKKPIALVNLHLEYGVDYRNRMLALQQAMVKKDLPCIMGGDTNNVQNLNLSTMIGDWHAATNIGPDGNLGLTTAHRGEQLPGKKPLQKAYDGFFVNPGRKSSAIITETGGMRFNQLEDGLVEYQPYIPTHPIHQSQIGQPWQPARKGVDNLPNANPANHQRLLKPINNYYEYTQSNRYHLFNARYNGKKGDPAKTAILKTLAARINACQDVLSLDQIKADFLSSNEYKILSTGQGLATKIFRLKTSSVKAVEQMFHDAYSNLNTLQPHP